MLAVRWLSWAYSTSLAICKVMLLANSSHVVDNTSHLCAVQWLSWAYSTSSALDKVMLLANTASGDAWLRGRCHRRGPWWRACLGMEQKRQP